MIVNWFAVFGLVTAVGLIGAAVEFMAWWKGRR
jgi:hypothetical protein